MKSGGEQQGWRCREQVLTVGARPLIMGILNVTPDSFSDGSRYLDPADAVSHGRVMIADGVDIIDIGGESTRPGAAEVSDVDEIARVIPVVRELSGQSGVVISIDTTKSVVARQAIEAGASIINDVSAFTHDPAMVDVARESGSGVVLMHMVGTPRTMQDNPQYADVVAEVSSYLHSRVQDLVHAGIAEECLAVDPGIGFGKTVAHNIRLLANLQDISVDGRPVVVGLSRKSMLGKITGRPTDERLAASLAGAVYSVLNGADIVRVHDVRESIDAVRIASALAAG